LRKGQSAKVKQTVAENLEKKVKTVIKEIGKLTMAFIF
jgi:hypothetical protein